MSEARLGYGTLLQRYDEHNDWVTVAEQVTINGPSLASDDVEVTNHDSPNSAREYIPGLTDTGEVGLDGNFIPGAVTQQQLILDQQNRTVANWRIVLPDAEDIDDRMKWWFKGYVKTLDFTYPTPTQMVINGTIKLTGPAVFSVDEH